MSIFAVLFSGGNFVRSVIELLDIFVHDSKFTANARSSW